MAHLCRDEAVRKLQEATAESQEHRRQLSAAAERAAAVRAQLDAAKEETAAAKKVTLLPVAPTQILGVCPQ